MNTEEFVVKTENLSKTYGRFFWKKKEPSLDALSLQVPQNTVFGFLGPNGAGKTTTIRLLMGLIKATDGKAWVLGKPAEDVNVKRRIGYLPDGPAFSSYLKAYEFLNICAKLLRIPSRERRKRIEEVLEVVKMSEHANSKLGGFSRGMTQRIGIAQAILNKPELLILDEPLVGLDPHGRQELKEIVSSQRRAGTSVFFCSHILSDVEKICDRVGILSRGKLMCCGRLEELLGETGMRVVIRPGHDELLQGLLPQAASTMRLSDGGWEIVFSRSDAVKDQLENYLGKHPESLTVSPSRESLEDYFFRKVASEDKKI